MFAPADRGVVIYVVGWAWRACREEAGTLELMRIEGCDKVMKAERKAVNAWKKKNARDLEKDKKLLAELALKDEALELLQVRSTCPVHAQSCR